MSKTQSDALRELFDATIQLFHRLRWTAMELHGEGEMTAGVRGVLRSLAALGPQTVPQMAAARPVSRQHIQTLVNELLEREEVELIPNPGHKRSSIVRITRKGKAHLKRMDKREQELLSMLQADVSPAQLRSAAATLRRIEKLLRRPVVLHDK